MAVATFDGRYFKLYCQGLLAEGIYSDPTGNTAHTVDLGGYENTLAYSTDYILSTYSSGSHLSGVSIGSSTRVNSSLDITSLGAFYSGSIGEVAIWDKALDAETILEIYSGSMGPYEKKFDLSYPGRNGSGSNHHHSYDVADVGLSYKNVGSYAHNLQGWWRLEEGTGSIAKDSSGKGRHMDIFNNPTWDGVLGTSASASPGVGPYTPEDTSGQRGSDSSTKYVIVSSSLIPTIDFSQVSQTSTSSLVYNSGSTKTFISYEGDQPSFVEGEAEITSIEIQTLLNDVDGEWYIDPTE
jgi:hypothetical protein